MTLNLQNATFQADVYNNGSQLVVQIHEHVTPLRGWTFRVMTPNFGATPIVPGTYDTSHDPLLPALVFSFAGDGNGCNSTAQLVIHAIELTPDRRALKTFRASFRDHHCYGGTPTMRGEIALIADPWR